MPFDQLFWLGGFPNQNRLQKKVGTLIVACLLEDLARIPRVLGGGTLPPTNTAAVGGYLEDEFPLRGPHVRCHVSGREDRFVLHGKDQLLGKSRDYTLSIRVPVWRSDG